MFRMVPGIWRPDLGDHASAEHPTGFSTRMIYWACAGVPIAAYLLSRRGRKGPDHDPTFDAFLKKRGALPTGEVEPAVSARQNAREHGGPIENFFKNAPATSAQEASVAAARESGGPIEMFFKNSGKAAAAASPAAAAADAAAAAQPQGPSPDDVRLTVMYGTEYGFSKEIAEKLCDRLRDAGSYWPVLVDMADHPQGFDMASEQVALLVCSTQGDGVPPTEAREFCEHVFAGRLGRLEALHFSVCALGDTAYAHFCRCGEMLDAALMAAGGQRLAPRANVNKEDWKAVNGWMDGVVKSLGTLSLKTIAEEGGLPAAPSSDAGHAASGRPRWGKSRPYYARVVAVEGLCNVLGPDDKNTIRVEFDVGDSSLAYLPGDALGIWANNLPQSVDELLAALGAQGDEAAAVPSWHFQDTRGGGGGPAPSTLRDVLQHCYDLRTPKSELLQLLWDATPEALRSQQPSKQNGVAENYANGVPITSNGNSTKATATLGNGAAKTVHSNGSTHSAVAPVGGPALLRALLDDAAQREEFLQPRHVIDVLEAFPHAKLSVKQVLSALRQLQPRLYSISSSPLENSQRVQVSVAEVRYSSCGRDRIGVCSTFLSNRIQVGDVVPVYVHKNADFRLPDDVAKPLIMIGPGTGLAPFRAFILHRLLQDKGIAVKAAAGPMTLFFGCRRRDQDYLYGELLESWARAGTIALFTAFSREQAGKVYVQQRVLEAADLLWQQLQAGGHIYVCGDAASMAVSVEAALLQLFQQKLAPQTGGDDAAAAVAAAQYLEELRVQERYQRDIWY